MCLLPNTIARIPFSSMSIYSARYFFGGWSAPPLVAIHNLVLHQFIL